MNQELNRLKEELKNNSKNEYENKTIEPYNPSSQIKERAKMFEPKSVQEIEKRPAVKAYVSDKMKKLIEDLEKFATGIRDIKSKVNLNNPSEKRAQQIESKKIFKVRSSKMIWRESSDPFDHKKSGK